MMHISVKRNVVRVNAANITYVNFSKANRASFKEYLEEEIDRLSEPLYIHIVEKHFRKKITDIYQKSDQIFPPRQLNLPMNIIHYVSLIQTILVSRH